MFFFSIYNLQGATEKYLGDEGILDKYYYCFYCYYY